MIHPISILLADDHAMVRATLGRRLNAEPGVEVVASVGTADEAVAESARLQPKIVLMDIDLPGMVCFEAARAIQTQCSGTRVIFLSGFCHDRYIEQALSVRAWGYIVKTESEQTLVEAIRGVARGTVYFSPEVQSRIVFDQGTAKLASTSVSRISTLSVREMEVLRHIAQGLSTKQAARVMNISEHTVHRHAANLMQKLEIHDRVELARYAIREGVTGT